MLLGLLAFSIAQSTSAQDVPSPIGPVRPAPSTCTGEPRTIDQLRTLFEAGTPADPAMEGATATVIRGTLADSATVQAITAVVHQVFACINAGDFGRVLAHMTDRAILTGFPWVGEMVMSESWTTDTIPPDPAPEPLWQTMLGIGSIVEHADGRASAVVVGIDPANNSQQPFALYLVFTEQEGVWLVDEIIDFVA
jgi:hypothetical protein